MTNNHSGSNPDQPRSDSHTDVHVETHSEQHVSSGSGAGDQADRVAELTADLQRVQADFMNFRRRADAEKADTLDFAKARVVREFLSVRDSFDAEAAHRPAGVDPVWAKSIDSIRTQFDQVLARLGVTRFESLGVAFDPHRHEAVTMDDSTGAHEVVVDELQPGYQLGETVLRPAMVKVGRTDDAPAAADSAPNDSVGQEPAA